MSEIKGCMNCGNISCENNKKRRIDGCGRWKSPEERIAELEKLLDIERDERNLFQERCEDILENYYCDHPCKCADLEKENAELKAQIEKMKNCKNCANYMINGDCPRLFRTGWCKNWQMTRSKK